MPSTTWTIPIDGTKKAVGPFPFKVRSVTVQNRCDVGNIWAIDDRGAQYEATPLTAVESMAEDTTYLTVYIDKPQAVGSAEVIVSDVAPLAAVTTSQLSSQAQASTVVSLPNFDTKLAADVAIAGANAFVDAVSIALPAGTYLLVGKACVNYGAANEVTAKLWDAAATVYDSAEFHRSGNTAGPVATVTLAAIVTLAVATTVHMSVATDVGGTTIKAATPDNPAGANATQLIAVQIG